MNLLEPSISARKSVPATSARNDAKVRGMSPGCRVAPSSPPLARPRAISDIETGERDADKACCDSSSLVMTRDSGRRGAA